MGVPRIRVQNALAGHASNRGPVTCTKPIGMARSDPTTVELISRATVIHNASRIFGAYLGSQLQFIMNAIADTAAMPTLKKTMRCNFQKDASAMPHPPIHSVFQQPEELNRYKGDNQIHCACCGEKKEMMFGRPG